MSSRPFGQGSIVAGRYRIIAPLGSGASARVFLADDLQLGRRVAVKVLHEALAEDRTFLKRFKAEAHSAAALNHPNVMHVYDSGDATVDEGPPLPFLVMEFVGGGSLRAVLDSGPPFSPSQALVVGLDAARGLEYAHQHGFVHRDIKPANLLFGEEGRLRIADFGLARALAEATWTEPEGVLLGTAKYSAPEQALGKAVDGRSDVYSLALVLVEAVTGEVPFARDSIQGTLLARTERDLEVPRSLGRLAPVLERAGRLDPDLRPDAGELVIAFLAASEDMDRPKPIGLPGAIPVQVLEMMVDQGKASAATDTDEHPVVDSETTTETDDGADDDGEPDGLPDDITLLAAADQTAVVTLPVVRTAPTAPVASTASVATASTTPTDAAPAVETPTGRVDIPLDDSTPEATAEATSRRWPWVLAAILLIGGLVGGAAYWWVAIRIPSHAVIDVGGMPVKQATRELEDLGFKVTSSFVRKDGTEADEVVGQKPKVGTELEEGRTVELMVSLGNTLVPVPVLDATMDEATVTTRLDEAGLVVGSRTNPFDETVPAGFLISSALSVAPDASGQVPKETPVDIVISAGPQPRIIPPSLVGQPIAEVQRQLEAIQLKVNVTQEFSDEPIDTVLRLNYSDNTEVPRDTVVEVATSKGPELFPIPNVLGQTGAQAGATLEAQGFRVAGVTGSPSGKVVGIAPPAGELHPKGTSVQLLTN